MYVGNGRKWASLTDWTCNTKVSEKRPFISTIQQMLLYIAGIQSLKTRSKPTACRTAYKYRRPTNPKLSIYPNELGVTSLSVNPLYDVSREMQVVYNSTGDIASLCITSPSMTVTNLFSNTVAKILQSVFNRIIGLKLLSVFPLFGSFFRSVTIIQFTDQDILSLGAICGRCLPKLGNKV